MSSPDNDKLLSHVAPMGESSTIVPDSVAIQVESQPPQYSPSESQRTSAPNPSSDNAVSSILKQSSHPTILILHVVFRLLALFLYTFANFVPSEFVLIFVLSVLFLSFDFWIVKNVSGRYLVGYRWWNEVDDLGHSQWYFETRENINLANPVDAKVFWISLYSTPVVWTLFALIALIKFQFEWILIVIVALMLSSANLLGYYKCEQYYKKKSNTGNSLGSGLFGSTGSVMGSFLSRSVSSFFG